MNTYCTVHIDFTDTTAEEDSVITSSDNALIGNLELFHSYTEQANYGTLELNQFILDGSKDIMEASSDIGFWSNAKSGNDCKFVVNPKVQFDFDAVHTSSGITMYFAKRPHKLKVHWYLVGNKLFSKEFYPDADVYFCKQQIKNFNKIVVEFMETCFPLCNIKYQFNKYGEDIRWTDEDVQAATLTEEVDITSDTLAINTASVSIVDTNNDFDLSNSDGAWNSIQKKQRVKLLENIDGKDVDCGVFYIDTWNSSNNIVNFKLVDQIGLLDYTKFYDGSVYKNVTAGTIIDQIMTSAGVTDYEVSDDVSGIVLNGYLGIVTHREALQQVAFACGALVDCSRGNTIKIYVPNRYISHYIGTNNKFVGTKVELDEYVSDVIVSYYKYTTESELSEIFSGTLPAGNNRIEFNEPYSTVSASAGTIVESHTNYVVVSMESEGTCVISGFKYTSTENSYRASLSKVDAGESPKEKSYGNCTLVDYSRVKSIAERILNFYSLRQKVSMRYLNVGEMVGNWCSVSDVYGKSSVTQITSQTIDLAGGNISDCQCRGYSTIVTEFSYSGEFFAGERCLI